MSCFFAKAPPDILALINVIVTVLCYLGSSAWKGKRKNSSDEMSANIGHLTFSSSVG